MLAAGLVVVEAPAETDDGEDDGDESLKDIMRQRKSGVEWLADVGADQEGELEDKGRFEEKKDPTAESRDGG